MKSKHIWLIVFITVGIAVVTAYYHHFASKWHSEGYTECVGEAQEFGRIPRLGNMLDGFRAEGAIKYQVISKLRHYEIHLVAHFEEGAIDEGLKAHPELDAMPISSEEEPHGSYIHILRELEPQSMKYLSGETLWIGGRGSLYDGMFLDYDPQSRILWGVIYLQRGEMPSTENPKPR